MVNGCDAARNAVITLFSGGIIEKFCLCFIKQNSAGAGIGKVPSIHSNIHQSSAPVERFAVDKGDAAGNGVIAGFSGGIIEQRGLCFIKQNSAGAGIDRVLDFHCKIRQSRAPLERTVAYVGDAAGEGHARQTTAPRERLDADGGDAAGEGHARQSSAPLERPFADGGDAAGEGHARQSTAPRERRFADGGEAAGEGHARQTFAPRERIGADGGDAAGNDHARQTSAPPERIGADGGDAAGDGHARQSFATEERIFADGSDAAGDGVIARFSGGIIEKRCLCFVKQNSADAAINAVCGIHSETR